MNKLISVAAIALAFACGWFTHTPEPAVAPLPMYVELIDANSRVLAWVPIVRPIPGAGFVFTDPPMGIAGVRFVDAPAQSPQLTPDAAVVVVRGVCGPYDPHAETVTATMTSTASHTTYICP